MTTTRDQLAEYISGTTVTARGDAADILRDFIVIPRVDLPKVDVDGQHLVVKGNASGYISDTAELHRNIAARHLALAEYLEQHPPVDEAQVDALAALLLDADNPEDEHGRRRALHYVKAGEDAGYASVAISDACRETARALLATGRIYLAKEA